MIKVRFEVDSISCKSTVEGFVITAESWVQIATLICALMQMILTFRYFFKTKSFFEKLNKDYAEKIQKVFGSRV